MCRGNRVIGLTRGSNVKDLSTSQTINWTSFIRQSAGLCHSIIIS